MLSTPLRHSAVILAAAAAILLAALMLPHSSAAQTTQCVDLTRTLRLGSTDATTNGEVSKLQRFLTETGDYTYGSVTGYFGPATEEAVKRFQCRKGIICEGSPSTTGYGVVGARTRAAMRCSGTTPPVTGSQCVVLQMNLYRGHTDAQTNGEVSKLQQFLKDHGHYTGAVNGTFDEATENAVKAYQCARGIICSGTPDTTGYGMVGPKTRQDMRRNCGTTSTPPFGGWTTNGQCPQHAMQCPDGSWVSATGPQCRFICPGATTTPSNRPPVIEAIEGPTTRNVDETGRWRIKATDPENGILSYRVSWGDGASTQLSLTDTFDHAYSSAGTFSLVATVKDDGGAESVARLSVRVGNPTGGGCPELNDPVCGIPPHSVCFNATSCQPTTYTSRCALDAANATFLYAGACRPGGTNTPPVCGAPAIRCHDGSYVSPTGPNCTYPACPGGGGWTTNGQCPQDARQCPDGSYVQRTGPDCLFAACPGAPTYSQSAYYSQSSYYSQGSYQGGLVAPQLLFSATPVSVPLGSATTLNWQVTGAQPPVDFTCTLRAGGVNIATGLAANGSRSHTPQTDTVYTMSCTSAAWTMTLSASFVVTVF